MTLAKLGVNIDHVATLRQLRGTPYPDLLEASKLVEAAGADQITVHLREDRRHIQDADVKRLRGSLKISLNLEMAPTEAMLKFATRVSPDWACFVPEKRQELTTEGGLDLSKSTKKLEAAVAQLRKFGIQVSLFIEPSIAMVKLASQIGANAVEFHTGRYCLATQPQGAASTSRAESRARTELARLEKAARMARKLGLSSHAGHGFDYQNVRPVAAMAFGDSQLITEFNIGHSIVCRAVLVGLERAVREMISSIQAP